VNSSHLTGSKKETIHVIRDEVPFGITDRALLFYSA